jgi:hypothetical protein
MAIDQQSANEAYLKATILDDKTKKEIVDRAIKIGKNFNSSKPILSSTDEYSVAEDFLLKQGLHPDNFNTLAEWKMAVYGAIPDASKEFLYSYTPQGKSEARASKTESGIATIKSSKKSSDAQAAAMGATSDEISQFNWNDNFQTNPETGAMSGYSTRSLGGETGPELFQMAGPYGTASTFMNSDQRESARLAELQRQKIANVEANTGMTNRYRQEQQTYEDQANMRAKRAAGGYDATPTNRFGQPIESFWGRKPEYPTFGRV